MLGGRRLICIICPFGCEVTIKHEDDGGVKLGGYACDRGRSYAQEEYTSPKRVLTTLVLVKDGALPVTSVKTTKPIPKELLGELQRVMCNISLKAPVDVGDIVIRNVLKTNVDVVVTRSVKRTRSGEC